MPRFSERFWPRTTTSLGQAAADALREEQDRLAREQVGRLVDGLALTPAEDLLQFPRTTWNAFNLAAGARPLPTIDVVDTVVASAAQRTVVSNAVTVRADARFEGLFFQGEAGAPLVTIDGAVATFHGCIFDRGPGSSEGWASFLNSAQGIFVGCWFVGDATPAEIVVNTGGAADVQIVACYQRTTGPVAWGANTTQVGVL